MTAFWIICILGSIAIVAETLIDTAKRERNRQSTLASIGRGKAKGE